MKTKAFVFLLLGLLVLAAGGYWLYQRYLSPQQYPLRALVPSDAVLVYSSTAPGAARDSLQQHPFGEVLRDIPGFSRLKGYEEELQRLLPTFERLQEREFLFSLHITERHAYDYLLLLPFGGKEDVGLLKDLGEEMQDRQAYSLQERTYQGQTIYEIRDKPGARTFSFVVVEGVLAGSFTPFLVEAVIRQQAEGRKEEIPVWLKENGAAAMGEALGNLSINLRQLPKLLRVFAYNDTLVHQMLPQMPYYTRLDALTASEGLLLTGYTHAADVGKSDFLWALHDQKPQKMQLDYLVPLRAASLMFVGMQQPKQWHQHLRTYWQLEASEQWERWQVLQARVPEAEALIPLLGKELGLATVPTLGSANPDRLLLVHMPDSEASATALEKVVGRMAGADTLYSETFLRHQLRELPYQEFPAALLGSAYLGFEECYYTQLEDYLVLSSSIPALKEMLLDLQSEETWQRSVRLNKFLSRLDAEQNYALYLNTTALWPMLYRRMAPPWKEFWDKHGLALRQIDLLSLQLSASEGAFYTNLFLHLDRRPERKLEQIQLSRQSAVTLGAPVVHAPQRVSYRQQRRGNWLVQDTARMLYLLNDAGEKINTRRLGSAWIHGIAEVDPRKNKTPHYFLISRDSAYVLQPNLQNLPPFPMALPQQEKLGWSSVIDYDGSLRYRFLLASEGGNLYMYDLDGVNLEGWQPKALQGGLSAAPGHLRVRSKDIIYAFQKKGVVQLFNRRGEGYPGFPLNLGDSLLGPVHVRQGSDFSSTRFITVTASGLFYEWDLNGKVHTRRQLFRPDVRSRFYLVPDARGKRFLIAQQDRFRLRLLNENGSELFEKDYLGASSLVVQYFPFTDAAALVAVTDPDQEFTYLYDLRGNLLQTQPFNSCCPLSLQLSASGDSLRLVKAYNAQVEQFLLPAINSAK